MPWPVTSPHLRSPAGGYPRRPCLSIQGTRYSAEHHIRGCGRHIGPEGLSLWVRRQREPASEMAFSSRSIPASTIVRPMRGKIDMSSRRCCPGGTGIWGGLPPGPTAGNHSGFSGQSPSATPFGAAEIRRKRCCGAGVQELSARPHPRKPDLRFSQTAKPLTDAGAQSLLRDRKFDLIFLR